jgi:Ca-activated chloride channel homolog
MMMPLELIRPWLLLLLLPAALIVYVFYRLSLSDFAKPQRLVSLAARMLIIAAVILAIAGLHWLRTTEERFVVVLNDESQSIGEQGAEMTKSFVKSMQEASNQDRVVVLPFAESPGKVIDADAWLKVVDNPNGSPRESTDLNPAAQRSIAAENDKTTESSKYRRDTHIAAAIQAAAGYMPPGYVPHMVLLTDGNETLGDALSVASQSRIPISTVPLPAPSSPEVQMAEVNLPAEVREGEPFMVEVVVQSNHDDEGIIDVFRGDHKVLSEKKPIKKGENRFRFQQSVDRERLAVFQVRVSELASDTLLDNNATAGLVYASGKPRVLIIESDPSLIRELAYALEDEGIQVDVRPPQGMPETLADLQNYETLILSNVPATSLTQQQMQLARTWVQELGGGFMMLGGEQSFGLGGYYKSTLEEILPVRSDFEKEKEKPSLGIVLVIDRSGSMSGDRIEMAKSAARAAVELLGNKDQVAVLAFDHETYVVSDMQSATNKAKIIDDIARVESSGGTNMYPAMEQAFELLQRTSARLKHAIFLTDGISTAGDFEGIAQQMASAKMTVSTVAVGDGSDTNMLEQIAKVGKGRYYFTADPAQVPQIFAKETVTASKSAIDEQPFVPQVIRTTYALADIDMETAPFLLGYVMTRPKPTCEVILATEKGDPLLAWWRYGLGMAVAFTSDAKSRWAAEWMTWPGYGKFWTQIVRQTMRKSDGRGISVALDRQGNDSRWSIDVANELGGFLNQAEVEMSVIDPQMKRETKTIPQMAPGRYGNDLKVDQPGAYHVDIAVKQSGQVIYRQSRGLIRGYSDELRIRPTNEEWLREIASVSGGRHQVDAKELFKSDGRTATRPQPLWPWLLTFACAMLIIDVALRRLDLFRRRP